VIHPRHVVSALRTAVRNENVRRAELAWGAAIAAEWAHFVALGVFAYQHGGAASVGVAGLVRLLPAGMIAPFAAAFGDDPDVLLDIGGDGEERSALETLSRSLGLADRVRFLGLLNRSEVRTALWGSDAMVSASFVETFGVSLIEAMATGLPVVATRCGGPAEFVHQGNGLLVDPGEVEPLAAALRLMRATRASYCEAGIRAETERRFGPHVVASQLLDVYEGALGWGRGRGPVAREQE
jgi:glycosyltransferase involved in cell wall biosynthesis